MPLTREDERAVDEALSAWRQGDVSLNAGLEFLHLADLSRPHSPASMQMAVSLAEDDEETEAGPTPVLDTVRGMVMLSQTCDVTRRCRDRPFVEVSPLIEIPGREIEEIRRLKRPAFAYVPATAEDRLVADLDRTMTVEKALVAGWNRIPGWETNEKVGISPSLSSASGRARPFPTTSLPQHGLSNVAWSTSTTRRPRKAPICGRSEKSG